MVNEVNEYMESNRFQNLDGIEYKIIQKLLNSDNKYANNVWRILKYNTQKALNEPALTRTEKLELVSGTPQNMQVNTSADASQDEIKTRVFLYPFVDEAWTLQATAIYIYVNKIEPINIAQSNVDVVIETVTHASIGVVATEADSLSNPDETNPNDYIYTDDTNPYVEYKSRITVLLKSLLAALNGMFIDGVGYLQFNRADKGLFTNSKVEKNLYNRHAFFGDTIHFNVVMSGISDTPDEGF